MEPADDIDEERGTAEEAAAVATDGGDPDEEEGGESEGIGGWEWNITLAAQTLSDAESAFQALVQQEGSGDNVDDPAEDDFVENESSSNTYNDESMYAPPRKNRFIAPHRRPRKTRREYRLSPLEPIHDEKLIPSLSISDIASAIPAAVERERLFEQHPLPLLMGKKLWTYKNLDYGEDHPMAGYGGGLDDVTPDDWAMDDGKDGKHPWPNGTPYNASVLRLCWNYFVFTYGKAPKASNKVVFWEVVASFIPPACSYLFGTGLIDELSGKTSRGETEEERMFHASMFAIGILLLQTLGSYLTTQPNHCGHSINGAPTGGARAGLRDTLFHRMRHLKSPLKDKITPGGASGIIVDKVSDAVNIYAAFLAFPAIVTGILAQVAVSITTLRDVEFTGVVILPMAGVILLSLLLPILINMWYQPELCILTRLEHQWRLRLRAVAGTAIPLNGETFVSKKIDDGGGRRKGISDDGTTKTDDKEEAFRKIFHQCVYLENMRHFHSWKMSVVILFLVSVLTNVSIAVVTIIGAFAVITGRGVTVGNFSTLVASVSGIIKLGDEMGSFFTNLYENHTMLKQISCIMNDEDIGFDGGVDPFGSLNSEIKDTGKHAVERFKHAVQHTHHHHKHLEDAIQLELTKSDT